MNIMAQRYQLVAVPELGEVIPYVAQNKKCKTLKPIPKSVFHTITLPADSRYLRNEDNVNGVPVQVFFLLNRSLYYSQSIPLLFSIFY